MKTIPAAKCKAHFLATLKDIETKREPVVVTRNGKKVVTMIPYVESETEDDIFGFYRGKLETLGDVMAPLYTDQELDESEDRAAAKLG